MEDEGEEALEDYLCAKMHLVGLLCRKTDIGLNLSRTISDKMYQYSSDDFTNVVHAEWFSNCCPSASTVYLQHRDNHDGGNGSFFLQGLGSLIEGKLWEGGGGGGGSFPHQRVQSL